MRVAFITVGDTRRLTGGYLYHARVFAGLRARGVAIEEVVAGEAPLSAQLERAAGFGAAFDPRPFDVVVVDALARVVCAPWLDGWRAARPLVAMVHELPSVADPRDGQRALEQPLLRSDLLIAVSRHGRDILLRRGVPGERIRIVSPGYDRLPTARGGEDTARGPAARLSALCVAQWISRKGILSLVRAWARRPRPGALLELIGETGADPVYAAQVRRAIAQARPDAPIRVRGSVDDTALADAYRDAALFVLASAYEGYGMVYAEALAHGLPVVACDIAPVSELLGAAGRLVPPDDPAALDRALGELLGDAELRARLAAAALRRAAELPTWDDAVDGFQRALEAAATRSM